MARESLITDGMRRAIGSETEPVVIEVDKTLITRFADGVGDPNPLWLDQEVAGQGPYGGLVAPPSLFCAVLMRGNSAIDPMRSALPARMLDGGGEWEILRPVHLGDTITVVNRLADVAERAGRSGQMVLVTCETTWRDQRQEVVAKARSTTIFY